MMKSENISDLKMRFQGWAVKVILLTRGFSKAQEFEIFARQMIRSASGAAANYRAACRAKSKRDFINKLKIVEEEVDESMFWIEMVVQLDPNLKEDARPTYQEADELLSITVSSIKTARKNEGK